MRHVAPGARGIPLCELVTGGEAGVRGEPWATGTALPSSPRSAPVGQPRGEVGQRVAEGGQLPVDDGSDPRCAGGLGPERDDGVVQAEVAVDQGRLGLGGCSRRQGPSSSVHARQVAGPTRLPLGAPAPQLALDVAVRPAEVAQTGGVEVDGVDGGEHVDEVVRQRRRAGPRDAQRSAAALGRRRPPPRPSRRTGRRHVDVRAERQHARDGDVGVPAALRAPGTHGSCRARSAAGVPAAADEGSPPRPRRAAGR